MSPSLPLTSATQTFAEVMSCAGKVLVTHPDDADTLAFRAVGRLRQLEQRWSRFVSSSEITRLNHSPDVWVTVSDDTVTLVEQLGAAHALTDGAFDPTLLRTMIDLGYDTSRTQPLRTTTTADSTAGRGRVDAVLVDRERARVQLPRGTALDPGGLGKGLAADLVTDELIAAGAAGCLVEIGGDLRVVGEPPAEHAWTIDIDGITDDEAPLVLATGGVATSSSLRRVWHRDGTHRHHLIDPRTLQPTSTGVVECTVAVGAAAVAEALTKVAFVRGLVDATGFYADRGIAARIVDADGSTVTTPPWRDLQAAAS